ncbi:MAG: hypothetical protein ACT4O1_02720 [Gemmatimonadota bacterium]
MDETTIEEQLGIIFVEGQRYQIWVRSEPDHDGTWHNALLFRRDGRVGSHETLITGMGWHAPPGIALDRARELDENEQLSLFRKALRPRRPLM